MTSYLAPGGLTHRVLNPLVMRLGLTDTLVVRTRSTGREQTVPVNVLDHGGSRYLVSARGETQWVRNLRAAGRCAVRRRGRSTAYQAEELPTAERPELIAAYRARWDSQVKRYFTELPDPADHPVFRLTPPA
jgi:deazaflavin-dependent oxidoreductase (nitroreductase family)